MVWQLIPNPPSDDNHEICALTSERVGAILSSKVKLPNTIPIQDGQIHFEQPVGKISKSAVTVNWQSVAGAWTIQPNTIGMPYEPLGQLALCDSGTGFSFAANNGHAFNVIPFGARTMIALGCKFLCVNEALPEILSTNPSVAESDKGVCGLLLRAKQAGIEMNLHITVTREALSRYWASWKAPAPTPTA